MKCTGYEHSCPPDINGFTPYCQSHTVGYSYFSTPPLPNSSTIHAKPILQPELQAKTQDKKISQDKRITKNIKVPAISLALHWSYTGTALGMHRLSLGVTRLSLPYRWRVDDLSMPYHFR